VARPDAVDSSVHYFFSDHLGSTSVITNSAGTTFEEDLDYFPYGGIASGRQTLLSTVAKTNAISAKRNCERSRTPRVNRHQKTSSSGITSTQKPTAAAVHLRMLTFSALNAIKRYTTRCQFLTQRPRRLQLRSRLYLSPNSLRKDQYVR
jgi:hypothetical protein